MKLRFDMSRYVLGCQVIIIDVITLDQHVTGSYCYPRLCDLNEANFHEKTCWET